MSLTDGFIEISSCNAYFASDTITDDFIIRTGSNAFQRLVFATMWSSNATMVMSNNIVSFASNVGIGKTNPLYALDVAGIVNATNLYVGGAPYVGSQWTTSGSNIFILGSNVGINTNSPQANLQVAGNMQVNGSTATKGFVLTRSSGLLSNYVSPPIAGFSNTPSNIAIYTCGSNATDSILFVTGSNPLSEKVRISGAGYIGVGTSTPSYPLHVTAGAASTSIFASGDIIGLSDESVKTDLIRISNALEKVKAINGYTFKRTDTDSDKRHAGVLAQEVVNILPEVVTETNGKLCVAYGNMIALLIEAVKELSDKVDKLLS